MQELDLGLTQLLGRPLKRLSALDSTASAADACSGQINERLQKAQALVAQACEELDGLLQGITSVQVHIPHR